MSQTFQIPIVSNAQPAFIFPDRCICCGAPKQSESALAINRLVMRGQRQEQLSLKYQIPHCQQCARSTRTVFLAGFIPFVLGVLLVGGITFAMIALRASMFGLDDYGQPGNANSLVLGAAAGLAAGLAGGFLFELMARIVLLPIFGRALLQAPLLAAQFMTDADYVAGLTGKLNQQASILQLTFANDEIVREFQTLNTPLLDTSR